MKKIVIKYNEKYSDFLDEALKCIKDFENEHLSTQKLGITNGVLWVMYNKKNDRRFQIYVYHTKTQIVCDIR